MVRRGLILMVALAVVGCGQAHQTGHPAGPPPPTPAHLSLAAGSGNFAGRLLSLLAASDQNISVSPFSISDALAMTYAGARGQTAAQMARVLGLRPGASRPLEEQLGSLRTVDVANALYGQRGVPFLPAFLGLLARDYQAPLHVVDFVRDPEGARNEINAWVAAKTHGKIPQLLGPGGVDASTRLALINAIYLNAKWEVPFDASTTAAAAFHAPGGTVQVPTMHESGDFGYLRGDGYSALELPYRGGRLVFDVLLPDTNGLSSLLERITRSGPAKLVRGLHPQQVRVALPKLRLDTHLQLAPALSKLGMPLAFSCGPGGANFSGIAPRGLCISHVVHEAFVRVDEAGTEAAAATGVTVIATAIAGPPPIEFDVNRPFVFVLRDTQSGAILFEGAVNRP